MIPALFLDHEIRKIIIQLFPPIERIVSIPDELFLGGLASRVSITRYIDEIFPNPEFEIKEQHSLGIEQVPKIGQASSKLRFGEVVKTRTSPDPIKRLVEGTCLAQVALHINAF